MQYPDQVQRPIFGPFSYPADPTPRSNAGAGFGWAQQPANGASPILPRHAAVDSEKKSRPMIRLEQSPRARDRYDRLANLYSIIKTVEHLDNAFVRDAIDAETYTPECYKLLSQFKAAIQVVDFDLDQFLKEYRMNCKAAEHRLKVGLPLTVEHGATEKRSDNAAVAACVQYFITCMDSLRLNMTAVDEIQPLVGDVLDGLNKIEGVPDGFEGKIKAKEWLRTLQSMKASDQLNEEQLRQMLFDLERAYGEFMKFLGSS